MAIRFSSPTFVGRAAELGLLEDARRRAAAGPSAAVVVGGEAGVGKTRLIDEFARRARAEGVRVLVGVCVELGEPLVGGLVVAAGAVAVEGGQCFADSRGHAAAVAADVDVRAVFERLPHRVGGGGDGVLDVTGRVVDDRGEGGVDLGDSGLLPGLHLLLVEVVVFGVAAADEDL